VVKPWSTPCPGRWNPRKRYPVPTVGGWVGLYVWKISPQRRVDPRTVQPVESRSFVRSVKWLVIFVGSQYVILRHVNFLAPRIVGWLRDFCKFCAPPDYGQCHIWHLISKAAFYTSTCINFPTSPRLLITNTQDLNQKPIFILCCILLNGATNC
jgi:hypothetical protein